jgi:hypothetical protein
MPDMAKRNPPALETPVLILAIFGLLLAAPAAFVAVIAGIGEQRAADHAYVVGFAHVHDNCGPDSVTFDLVDGAPLGCEPAAIPMGGPSRASFPGFTDDQDRQVTELADQLGEDGLSPAEQQQIQRMVDGFAAKVPDSRRPHFDEGVSVEPLWGAGLAWTGVAVLIACLWVYSLAFEPPRWLAWVLRLIRESRHRLRRRQRRG